MADPILGKIHAVATSRGMRSIPTSEIQVADIVLYLKTLK